MANIVFRLLGNVLDLADTFTDVAFSDPLSAVLMVSGAVFVLFSVGVLGYLATGALLSGIIPENIGRTPPQQGE